MTDNRGFPEKTDFDNDALGLDPASCGCVDCLVGYAVPFDSPRLAELAAAYVDGRKIVNRTSCPIILVVRHDGSMVFQELTAASVVAVYPVI